MIWHYSAFRRGGVRNTSRWGFGLSIGRGVKTKGGGAGLDGNKRPEKKGNEGNLRCY